MPKIDVIEPMLMILPPAARHISGYTACEQVNAPVRLIVITLFQSSSV